MDQNNRPDPSGLQCWVCLATNEEDPLEWIDPCNCTGSTKWVHLPCLMRWVDEKQQGNLEQDVFCPHCNSLYRIKEPRRGLFFILVDKINKQLYKLSHAMAGGIIVGSIYWLAVTYGAVTVVQVLGHAEGFAVLEKADPLVLLIALPTVPVTLIFSRFISWDDTVMHFLRHCAIKSSLLGRMFPLFALLRILRIPWSLPEAVMTSCFFYYRVEKPHYRLLYPEWEKTQQSGVQTRIICGGLILPSMATFVGRILFKSHTAVQRTLYGGLTYILVKGLLKIYHKQNLYYRMCKRTVLRASGEPPLNLVANVDDALAPS